VTPQFGASLIDDARVVLYDCTMFMVEATGLACMLWTFFRLSVTNKMFSKAATMLDVGEERALGEAVEAVHARRNLGLKKRLLVTLFLKNFLKIMSC
jgi:hypothetical protein